MQQRIAVLDREKVCVPLLQPACHMLRLRCALWLWLTTVAPALSFTLAPFTQRPRPSTTRIFSDEVDDVECAPNDDECVANLSDDDYSDDAGALEVIDDDAPAPSA